MCLKSLMIITVVSKLLDTYFDKFVVRQHTPLYDRGDMTEKQGREFVMDSRSFHSYRVPNRI